MKFLITGGAGYIGSVTNAFITSQGHETIIFDSLVNGHKESVGKTPLSYPFCGIRISRGIHGAAI
jgi:UDP-glucose 4-epimerase